MGSILSRILFRKVSTPASGPAANLSSSNWPVSVARKIHVSETRRNREQNKRTWRIFGTVSAQAEALRGKPVAVWHWDVDHSVRDLLLRISPQVNGKADHLLNSNFSFSNCVCCAYWTFSNTLLIRWSVFAAFFFWKTSSDGTFSERSIRVQSNWASFEVRSESF